MVILSTGILRNNKYIIINFLFITLTNPLGAINGLQTPTQNIRGRVTDIQTTVPLPGAAVALITNLLNRNNIFDEKFNKITGETEYTDQLGFMFIPHYRIIF